MHHSDFYLGILSFLQIAFIPGLILLGCVNIQLPALRKFILSFPLSLTINYWLVLLLCVFKQYKQHVFWAILAVEVVWLAYLYRRAFIHSLKTSMSAGRIKLDKYIAAASTSSLLLLFIALLTIAYYINHYVIHQVGTVFTQWDAVVSWNRWAIEWATQGKPNLTFYIPQFTDIFSTYPQLIPVNNSIPYVVVGSIDGVYLQFFSKIVSSLFLLFLFLGLLDLGRTLRDKTYYLAIPLTLLTFVLALGIYIGSGYVDIPVATMCFFPVYLALLQQETTSKSEWILGAILAGSAAVTKQAGLYILLIYPLLCWCLTLRNSNTQIRFTYKHLISLYMIGIVVALPWYVFNYVTIMSSQNQPTPPIPIFDTESYTSRLHDAMIDVRRYGLIPLGILSLISLLTNRTSRLLVISIAIPGFFFWALFLTYDIRNIALILPFVGISSAFACIAILGWICKPKLVREKFTYGVLILCLIALFGIVTYPNKALSTKSLLKRQTYIHQQMGWPKLNAALLAYKQDHDIHGKIATLWQFLKYIPGLDQYYQFNSLQSPANVDKAMNNPKVGYILAIYIRERNKDARPDIPLPVQAYIQTLVKKGKLSLVVKVKGARLYKKE